MGRGLRWVPALTRRHPWLFRRVPAACAVLAGLFFLLSLLFPLPPPKPYSFVVEDRHGTFLGAFLSSDGVWRIRTSPGEIPERLKSILLQREDRWFYYHPGFNPVSLVRALFQNLRSGRKISGASTITMQIARMIEPKERTVLHKVLEIFRALQLEWKYSKKELLEMYLSMVPLGGNIEGLKSASLIYYQTPVERLNIAQLFDLILIPSDPNGLQPDKNPEKLFAMRKRQAAFWFARGMFSRDDSSVIWSTPSAAVRHQLPRSAPQFCLRVRERARGAAEVHSSLDLRTQRSVETLLSHHLQPWKRLGVQNGAVTVIDNRTREIVAYAGSGDFDDEASQGQVDAVRALRSPGSTLKPFLFAFQMDRGDLTPRTRLLDTPYDAEGFLAENYDGTYSGFVYADEALRRSLNVPMIRLLRRAGVGPFVDFLSTVGITSLGMQKPKLGLSLILGGCGVTLEEMTAAYAAFPNGGTYQAASYLSGADNRSAPVRAFSPATAYMVTDILAGIERPDLPSNFEASVNLPAVAFKTGTSYGRRDAWSIGYSSEYTVGVWIGNVTHRGSPDLVGSRAAAPLLIDIFTAISTTHQKTILPPPADLGVRPVCAESGLAPTERCGNLITDLYSITRTNTRSCNVCKEYFIAEDGTLSYCPTCLGDHPFRTATYREHPAELLSYWTAAGIAYAQAPPHNPACTRIFSGDGPLITSPSERMTYFLFSRNQKLSLQASSGLEVKEHVWYLNDRFLGKRKAGEKLLVSMAEGNHTVFCMDDHGRSSAVRITVKLVL
jgi:penicillin-binding protein 1C